MATNNCASTRVWRRRIIQERLRGCIRGAPAARHLLYL